MPGLIVSKYKFDLIHMEFFTFLLPLLEKDEPSIQFLSVKNSAHSLN